MEMNNDVYISSLQVKKLKVLVQFANK